MTFDEKLPIQISSKIFFRTLPIFKNTFVRKLPFKKNNRFKKKIRDFLKNYGLKYFSKYLNRDNM